MTALFAFIAAHWVAISGASLYTLSAAIGTMQPKRPIDWYQWFYDWSHVMINHAPKSVAIPAALMVAQEKLPEAEAKQP
jgi:hypothetical protein